MDRLQDDIMLSGGITDEEALLASFFWKSWRLFPFLISSSSCRCYHRAVTLSRTSSLRWTGQEYQHFSRHSPQRLTSFRQEITLRYGPWLLLSHWLMHVSTQDVLLKDVAWKPKKYNKDLFMNYAWLRSLVKVCQISWWKMLLQMPKGSNYNEDLPINYPWLRSLLENVPKIGFTKLVRMQQLRHTMSSCPCTSPDSGHCCSTCPVCCWRTLVKNHNIQQSPAHAWRLTKVTAEERKP